MLEANEIGLLTDDYSISKRTHEETKSLFSSLGFEVNDERCDTSAAGGPGWLPHDFVLSMSSHLFDAALGVILTKGLDKLINIYKQVKQLDRPSSLKKDRQIHFYISTDLAFSVQLYFELDTFNYFSGQEISEKKEIEEAFRKIPYAYSDIQSVLTEKLFELLGKPMSIILRYDFVLKCWLIYDHDSDASIFFADTPFAAKPENNSIFKKISNLLRNI